MGILLQPRIIYDLKKICALSIRYNNGALLLCSVLWSSKVILFFSPPQKLMSKCVLVFATVRQVVPYWQSSAITLRKNEKRIRCRLDFKACHRVLRGVHPRSPNLYHRLQLQLSRPIVTTNHLLCCPNLQRQKPCFPRPYRLASASAWREIPVGADRQSPRTTGQQRYSAKPPHR